MPSVKNSSRATWKSYSLQTGKYYLYLDVHGGFISGSWTAVVRGALMKGLASTSPAFATVRISERSARKHYGINCGVPDAERVGVGLYLDLEHEDQRKVWDACSGFYRIYMMDWFIQKVLVLTGHARLGYRDRADTK